MGNSAHKIAGPIINRAMGQAGCDSFKLAREVRAALQDKAHPCVVDEWANEPGRRIMLGVLHRQRRARASKISKAIEARREAKRHRQKKAHRIIARVTTAARKFFSRPLFRRTARGQ